MVLSDRLKLNGRLRPLVENIQERLARQRVPRERNKPAEIEPSSSAMRWLIALGLVSALVYWQFFTVPFPLGTYYTQGHVDYAWLTQYRSEGTALFMATFGVLFGLQLLALSKVRGLQSSELLTQILAGHVAFSAVLLWMYPAAAVDVYDYYLYGRISLFHGGNPFLEPPRDFPMDPYLYLSPWQAEPSVYGPVWQIISLIPTLYAGDDLLRALLAFKITVILGSLITALLIYLTLKRFAPERALAGTLFFAWNPLVLFETAGNAHNDSVLTAFMMLGIYALIAGPRWGALPGVAAAVLTKVPAVMLGPLMVLGLYRSERWSKARLSLGIGLAASLGLAAVTYAAFWEGMATLSFLGRGHWFTASPATLLREVLRWQGLDFEVANQYASVISAALFGLCYLISMVLYWRSTSIPKSDDEVIDWHPWLRAGFRVTMAYMVIAALWWHAWYLLMLVCFAALLGDPALETRTNLFCFGGLLSYVVFKYIWWYWEPQGDYFKIMLVSVIAIFSLPALHWLMCQLDRFERRRAPVALKQLVEATEP